VFAHYYNARRKRVDGQYVYGSLEPRQPPCVVFLAVPESFLSRRQPHHSMLHLNFPLNDSENAISENKVLEGRRK